MDYDAIIIGCGNNGLVAAFYLARAGLRVLGLERNAKVGGACATDELIPGFHFSTCAHSFVLFHPEILHDMQLENYGLHVYNREPEKSSSVQLRQALALLERSRPHPRIHRTDLP